MSLDEAIAHLASWPGRPPPMSAPPLLCSSGGAAYISGRIKRSEVLFDWAGARFRSRADMGARVRRDGPEGRAAEPGRGSSLLCAGGEKGSAGGRQRLRLAGRDDA